MKTQIEFARDMQITPQMGQVGKNEGFDPETIREKVAFGEIVIPNNPHRTDQKIVGIGTGLRTKINASIGTSSDISDINEEIAKYPERRKKREKRAPSEESTCTMCGDFCAMKKGMEVFKEDIKKDKIYYAK